MPLKKFGEKLKSSLHHLSPKSKKHDEAVDGDLSPCSLPTVATSQQQQQPVQQSTQGAQQVCNPIPACANETNKLAEDKPAMGSVEQPKAQDVPESMRIQTPVPPPTVIEPASLPPDNAQLNSSSCGCENATPRWQANADIFPTMYYLIKTHSKEPINQSVLLVNPSKSDKTFNLRLCGGTNATLEKEAATIAGDYVDRVNVTITPEKETEDVYIDLLQGGNLYDKIRVQTQLL
ncbi:hypothetical protein, conserved [Eimeria praecox]|uniref:Uncharacterized protein n=1 Tax=Eimeria praecox TaxID=51316 RepID=U6H3W9_9EIME|nr:hypothetical protein, conserved [Eimeria praecox]